MGAAETVVLSLPVHTRYLATARVVAAALGAGAGFDVDEIDDLRLAVAEAAGVVMDQEDLGPEARLEVTFRVGGDHVAATFRASGAELPADGVDDLAGRILAAVVDRFEVVDGGISLVKSTAHPAEDNATAPLR